MPCTLSDWEIEIEEKKYNDEHFGLAENDHRLLTYVACAACRMLEKQEISVEEMEGFDLVLAKWWRKHLADDMMRQEQHRRPRRR